MEDDDIWFLVVPQLRQVNVRLVCTLFWQRSRCPADCEIDLTEDVLTQATHDSLRYLQTAKIVASNFSGFIETCCTDLRQGHALLQKVDQFFPDFFFIHQGYNWTGSVVQLHYLATACQNTAVASWLSSKRWPVPIQFPFVPICGSNDAN